MDERDLEAEQSFTRRVVDQVGSGALEFREGCPHVGDLVRDVMHPRPALRQEPPDRSVLAGWLEQLYPPLADAHRGRTHALLVDRGLVLDLGTEQPRIRGERLVEVIDGNAEVVDAASLHGGEATSHTQALDLHSDRSRSVSQAQPAYAQANSCDAATRSLAAPHG